MNDNYDFCPACGSLLKDGICMNCGMSVNPSAAENSQAASVTELSKTVSAAQDAEMKEESLQGAESENRQIIYTEQQNDSQSMHAGQPQNGGQTVYTDRPQSGGYPSYTGQPGNNQYGGSTLPNGAGMQSGGPAGEGQQQVNAPYTGYTAREGNTTYTNQPPCSRPYNNQVPPYTGGTQNYGQQYDRGYYTMQGPGGWQNDYGRQYGYNQPYPVKKSNNGVLITIIVVLAVLLFFSVIFMIALGSYSTEKVRSLTQSADELRDYYESQYAQPSENMQEEPEASAAYIPDAADDYYVTLADSIRSDLSYNVEWKDYSYNDDETGATSSGRYPQLLGGNIPHLDKLNEEIKNEATYYSNLYDYYKEQQYGESLIYNATSSAYVTYMDEEKMSIVFQEEFETDYESFISLYCINLDLISGEKMDNSQMIQYSDQLVDTFRKQNSYQNGTVEAVDGMEDDQLKDFLSDPQTNIIFYTPVGLELGFNYTTDSSSGWVTVTMKEYEGYLTKY